MRTWLLTSTTYGSWLPGDRRGSVTSVRDLRPDDPLTTVRIEHDIPGEPYEDEIPNLKHHARELLKCPPIYLDADHAVVLLKQFQETATYRKWELLAVSIMYNHFHMVVHVSDNPSPSKIIGDFKSYGSRALSMTFGKPISETWWTVGGSKLKLKDDSAELAGVNYVTLKQPNPLLVWKKEKNSEA